MVRFNILIHTSKTSLRKKCFKRTNNLNVYINCRNNRKVTKGTKGTKASKVTKAIKATKATKATKTI